MDTTDTFVTDIAARIGRDLKDALDMAEQGSTRVFEYNVGRICGMLYALDIYECQDSTPVEVKRQIREIVRLADDAILHARIHLRAVLNNAA